jgi:hypothetical protein
MAKDPAALLYIDKWIVATTEMKADARAYYMDLILFQFDKGSIPNDIEEIANICRVRISEFETFKQVFEQVLKHKFKQNVEGRLENEFAKEIIQKRKTFIEKRSNSGKLSYVIRYAIKEFKATQKHIAIIKDNICIDNIDTKNEQVLKQMIEQIYELYINVDEDEIINKYRIKYNTLYKKIIPFFDAKLINEKEYLNTIRLMIETDKRNEDEILKVVEFGRTDAFWKKQFLSFLKLRNKNKEGIMYYDVFLNQMPKIETRKENYAKNKDTYFGELNENYK